MIYHAIHVFVSYKRVFEQLMCKVFYIKAIKRGRAFWNWKTRLVFIIREWFDGKFFAYYCRFNCGLEFSWWWTNTKIDGSSCLFERSLYGRNVLVIPNISFKKVTSNYICYLIKIIFDSIWSYVLKHNLNIVEYNYLLSYHLSNTHLYIILIG